MTPQEALELLNDMEFAEQYQGKEEYTDMLLLCKNALEKQIPKKPINNDTKGIRYTDSYICPNCNRGFTGTGIADYCYHCGQALDWGD